jgi:hypothetical protein
MSIGLRRSAGGSDKNEILLDDVLFQRGQWFRKILQCRILMAPFLRISGLFEGGVMRPNLEVVRIGQTPRRLIIQRPEDYKEAKHDVVMRKNIRDHFKHNSRSINAKIRENFLLHSRRRATVERLCWNGLIIFFI